MKFNTNYCLCRYIWLSNCRLGRDYHVGKSTLIELFSEHHQRPLAEINLERFADLSPAFDSKDARTILNVLEALPWVGQISTDSLLFLDEIQADGWNNRQH